MYSCFRAYSWFAKVCIYVKAGCSVYAPELGAERGFINSFPKGLLSSEFHLFIAIRSKQLLADLYTRHVCMCFDWSYECSFFHWIVLPPLRFVGGRHGSPHRGEESLPEDREVPRRESERQHSAEQSRESVSSYSILHRFPLSHDSVG